MGQNPIGSTHVVTSARGDLKLLPVGTTFYMIGIELIPSIINRGGEVVSLYPCLIMFVNRFVDGICTLVL